MEASNESHAEPMSKVDDAKVREYLSKRDLRRSGEPSGGRRNTGGKPAFVIQKHDASSLYYDLRLEVDGVLRSWAVPKGPSTNPDDKRLAMAVEDHPLDYADFEGVIPEGSYGAGPVLVWDRGTYSNSTERDGEPISISEGIQNGHITFELHGKKLTGGFALTRFGKKSAKQDKWLLVKVDDESADRRRNPVSSQAASVISGRTIDEIAEE